MCKIHLPITRKPSTAETNRHAPHRHRTIDLLFHIYLSGAVGFRGVIKKDGERSVFQARRCMHSSTAAVACHRHPLRPPISLWQWQNIARGDRTGHPQTSGHACSKPTEATHSVCDPPKSVASRVIKSGIRKAHGTENAVSRKSLLPAIQFKWKNYLQL